MNAPEEKLTVDQELRQNDSLLRIIDWQLVREIGAEIGKSAAATFHEKFPGAVRHFADARAWLLEKATEPLGNGRRILHLKERLELDVENLRRGVQIAMEDAMTEFKVSQRNKDR